MPDFNHCFNEDENPFRLGQVLRDPHDISGVLERKDVFLPPDEVIIRKVQEDWHSKYEKNNISTLTMTFGTIHAKRFLSLSFQHNRVYIEQVAKLSSTKGLLDTKGKFYLIVGLGVAWDCTITTREVSTAEIGMRKRVADGPVICAYSLVRVKQSWLGNMNFHGYQSGNIL